MEISKIYNPVEHEDKIYKNWEKGGFFNPDNNSGKLEKSFSIVLPPPNVTGTLHLGHAAMLAIEDLLVRYKRMSGFDTLWLPGTDHAAIATQNVVEKKILKEDGLSRHDLGREKFLVKVAEYVDVSKDTIHNQLRKMGSSLDWSREAYTLDETRSQAVRKVFKMMFDDGLIYRGYRIVNWCPRCHSVLADDEIVYKEAKSKLYWIKYGPFVLATTRPETKLGDTAVAVNPTDERYKDMVGKKYMIPGVLGEFEITVIADESVDPAFGSGAVKVTPGHSMVDYEMAMRNHIKVKKIIDEDGRMMANCGKYAGMTTLEAREEIVKDMQAMGLIEKIDEDYDNKLSVCYRCKTVVEPLPSAQWFIDVNKKVTKKGNKYFEHGASLKEVSLKVVREKEINIIPERFEKIYFHWMENLRDWCVSRQIWFGHRIPVWYKKQVSMPILYARHGQSVGNTFNRLNSDVTNQENPLTDLGREQVLAQVEKMRKAGEKIDLIISSDMQRTKETAQIYADSFGAELIFDERLRDVGVGDFEGRENAVAEWDAFRNDFSLWHKDNPRGIESFVSLRTRVEAVLEEVKNKYVGKHILIVSHGDPLRIVAGYGADLDDESLFRTDSLWTGEAGRVDLACKKEMVVSEQPLNPNEWEQDEDTLDTWFSSGLWTFSTLLPKDWDGKDFTGADVKKFHPTTVLETGYDILFFWVARMILMTVYVMGEVPFENVYLHGLIRDKDGEKMSKSKPETAIDPVQAGEKYGFDAVRLSLLIGNTAGNDVRLYDEKIEAYRNFVNKLWNISRFILIDAEQPIKVAEKVVAKTLADEWILSRFNRLLVNVHASLDAYNFSQAGEELKDFTWNELADWYLEIAKAEKGKDEILIHILDKLLRLWHPFVPFVTEALWQSYHADASIMISEWPKAEEKLINEKAEKDFAKVVEMVSKIRNLRAEYKVEAGKRIRVCLQTENQEFWQTQEAIISMLARTEAIEFVNAKPDASVSAVVEGAEIYLPLAGLIDADKEKERLTKEKENLLAYVSGINKKLSNSEFVNNAPPAVVAIEQKKLAEAEEKISKLEAQLQDLK